MERFPSQRCHSHFQYEYEHDDDDADDDDDDDRRHKIRLAPLGRYSIPRRGSGLSGGIQTGVPVRGVRFIHNNQPSLGA